MHLLIENKKRRGWWRWIYLGSSVNFRQTLKWFWDPWIITFSERVPLIFFCQDLNWEILSLLAASNAASLRSEMPADPATTFVLVTVGTAMTPSMAGGSSSQHVPEACLPDFWASPFSRWLQGVKLFKFFKQTEQKPFWFTLITWMMHLVDQP